MTVFFSSDHHFFHENIIRYCDRPYDSAQEMNEDLINKWNSVVKPDDEVLYLGDFSLAFRAVELITNRLNGVKYLIPGNHDFCHTHHKKSRKIPGYIKWAEKYKFYGWHVLPQEILFDEFRLCHLPYKGDVPDADKYYSYRPTPGEESLLLCGHVHEKWKTKGNMINVGCDVWDYTPASLDQIRELAKEVKNG